MLSRGELRSLWCNFYDANRLFYDGGLARALALSPGCVSVPTPSSFAEYHPILLARALSDRAAGTVQAGRGALFLCCLTDPYALIVR